MGRKLKKSGTSAKTEKPVEEVVVESKIIENVVKNEDSSAEPILSIGERKLRKEQEKREQDEARELEKLKKLSSENIPKKTNKKKSNKSCARNEDKVVPLKNSAVQAGATSLQYESGSRNAIGSNKMLDKDQYGSSTSTVSDAKSDKDQKNSESFSRTYMKNKPVESDDVQQYRSKNDNRPSYNSKESSEYKDEIRHSVQTEDKNQERYYQQNNQYQPKKYHDRDRNVRYNSDHRESSDSDNWKSRHDMNWYSQKSSNQQYDDNKYNKFRIGLRSHTKYDYGKVAEKNGDLFSAPSEYSLAHCVAEDMSMGAGIAKIFKAKFRREAELLNQRAKTGGLAFLQDENRYIYYLVTKEKSYGKPTLYTLWQSLSKMKEHIVTNDVKKLAIPQIGCGLDRLFWDDVKYMLEYIFQDVDIKIVVYILQDENGQQEQKELAKAYVSHRPNLLLTSIENDTALLYLGTQNAYVSEEIRNLDSKFVGLIDNYRTSNAKIGEIITTKIQKEILYGLIVKKNQNDLFDFKIFESCLKKLNPHLNKEKFQYVGIQAFKDETDDLIMDKIIPLMQYTLYKQSIHVCWPEKLQHLCPEQKGSYTGFS